MTAKRLYHSIRLQLIRGPRKRAEYLKKHHLFGAIGDNCFWGPKKLPLYPELIKIHDNVSIHKRASLLTHDMINSFLKRCSPETDLGSPERLGCIEIMDNVYVATRAYIMPNVRIGKNCIVTVGSVVSSDIPENSIVAGVPAKPVGRFDMMLAMRKMQASQTAKFQNQVLPANIAEVEWEKFYNRHKDVKQTADNNID